MELGRPLGECDEGVGSSSLVLIWPSREDLQRDPEVTSSFSIAPTQPSLPKKRSRQEFREEIQGKSKTVSDKEKEGVVGGAMQGERNRGFHFRKTHPASYCF